MAANCRRGLLGPGFSSFGAWRCPLFGRTQDVGRVEPHIGVAIRRAHPGPAVGIIRTAFLANAAAAAPATPSASPSALAVIFGLTVVAS